MRNKTLMLLLGYTLFSLGITSIVMTLVGTHWYFLEWLEMGGRLVAFLIKIVFSIAGVLLIVLARTDWEKERQDSLTGEE